MKRWPIISVAAAMLALTAIPPHNAHAASSNSAVNNCLSSVNRIYQDRLGDLTHIADLREPALGEVSSCIRSLISMFNFDFNLWVPAYQQVINQFMNQVCQATQGEVTGIIGGGGPGGGGPGGGGPGGGGPGGGGPGGGGPGGGGPGGGGPGGGGPGGGGGDGGPGGGGHTRAVMPQAEVWDRLLNRYGTTQPPVPNTSKHPGKSTR